MSYVPSRITRGGTYIAAYGLHRYCEECGERQPFEDRFTPVCATCQASPVPLDNQRPERQGT